MPADFTARVAELKRERRRLAETLDGYVKVLKESAN
jgi:hypothetical protein